MSKLDDVKRADELFAARLQEVNKEMDTLLHKTSRTRHEMDRTAAEVRMGVPLHYHAGDPAASPLPYLRQPGTVADPIGGTLRDDLTRGVVSAELTQWVHTHLPSLIKPLVTAQVQQHLEALQTSVADLRTRQAEVELSAKDTAEQLREHRRELQAGYAATQRTLQRSLEEHQRSVEAQLGSWKEEVQRVREELRTMQDRGRSVEERQDRRLDDALQRQQERAQDTLGELDLEVQRWRQTLRRELEKDAQQAQQQHSALEGHVAQLQGMLASTADMATRCTSEIRQLMEDAVARSSEVRLCRRDVNRLEMLVQCTALQSAFAVDAPPAEKPKAITGDADQKVAEAGVALAAPAPAMAAALVHEVAHINEKIHATIMRMDGLDRHVRQLDIALARGAAVSSFVGAGGGVGAPHGSFYGSTRGGEDDSVYNRSIASTRIPSNSQLSSLTAGRGGSSSVAGGGVQPRMTPAFVNPAFTTLHHQQQQQHVDDSSSSSRPFTHGSSGGFSEGPAHPGARLDTFLASAGPSAASGGSQHSSNSGAFSANRHAPTAAAAALPRVTSLSSAVLGNRGNAQSHPPLPSNLSSSSLPFEDDADDPQPMRVVVSDSRSAPAAMMAGGGVTASRSLFGAPTSAAVASSAGAAVPAQRRGPARVIPVEAVSTPTSEEGRSGDGDDHDDDADSGHGSASHRGAAQTMLPVSATPAPEDASSEEERKDENGTESAAEELRQSHSGFSLDRVGEMYAVGGHRMPPQQDGGGEGDSYVSDTPAAAKTPEDSYVSDAAESAHGAAKPQDGSGQYTPAPASDSESERDNRLLSRSALD